MKKVLWGLAIVVLSLGVQVQNAHAVLLWDFDFTNSKQAFSPTDPVTLLARLSNNSTNGETIGGSSADFSVSLASATLPPEYGLFEFGPPPDHLFFDQFDSQTLTPGDTLDFTFGTFTPNPPGAPDGAYQTFHTMALQPNGGIVQFAAVPETDEPGGDLTIEDKPFNWTVASQSEVPSSAVPEPHSILLLSGGLIGMLGLRLRKK